MPHVTVIIPNWNGQRLLEACLSSVASQTFSDYRVLLVDNGSSDGSAEYVREEFPWVEVVSNPKNMGFAAAVNRAIEESDSAYVCTLNNDVWLEARWLEEMTGAAAGDSGVGMVASKILLVAAPDRLDCAGIGVDKAGFAWNALRGRSDVPGETDTSEVFGPCAAAALYRRDMLEEIGLFDVDFFAFLEDADLAWRARLAGWRCLYAPAARAYHVHSATAGQGSAFKAHLLARNRIWMVLKNYPWPQLLMALPLIAAYDMAALAGNAVSHTGRASLRGRLDAVKRTAAFWRKRRQVQALRRSDSQWQDFLYPLASPWQRWRAERRLGAITASAASQRFPRTGA